MLRNTNNRKKLAITRSADLSKGCRQPCATNSVQKLVADKWGQHGTELIVVIVISIMVIIEITIIIIMITIIVIVIIVVINDWLRTNGVNTNGAAAKVMSFDRLGEKVRPGTLGRRLTGVPKKVPLSKRNIR